jgi:hypothetical protein
MYYSRLRGIIYALGRSQPLRTDSIHRGLDEISNPLGNRIGFLD